MSSTLYVSDLDGTLLNNGSFVSDTSAQILRELAADGALFTVATARTPATVVPLMADTCCPLPYIVMTGAATYSARRHAYESLRPIPADEAAVVFDQLTAIGINPFVYYFAPESPDILSVYHISDMNEAEDDFYQQRRHLRLKRFTFESRWQGSDVVLLFGCGPTDQIRAAVDTLQRVTPLFISSYPDILRPGSSIIEAFAPGVSKASAIVDMADRVGADRIVVFGDNVNDLSMFEIADRAIAVSNALSSVKAAADQVIGPNYDDAVARFIADDFYSRAH